MRTLVIGDIHNEWQLAEQIIKDSIKDYEEIVIMGDYFDSYYDTLELAESTALWVLEKMKEPKIVLLFGNHDFHYFFYKNVSVRGSGYSRNKATVINRILKRGDWHKLLFYYLSQGFVFSHGRVS